jgi:hypothetical protein
VVGAKWQFEHPQEIWARQFNPEGNELKVTNNGADLWILGLKTEGSGMVISTGTGGKTELLGGLLYPARSVPIENQAFRNDNSSVSLTYATSAYADANDYPIFVRETQLANGTGRTRDLLRTDTNLLYPRGYGSFMLLYRGAPGE